MTLAAFQPKPKGYPTIIAQYSKTMAAMGNKKTSVLDKKGSVRYPKCVMYQYQLKAPAYKVFATIKGTSPSPSTKGKRKNCSPSVMDKAWIRVRVTPLPSHHRNINHNIKRTYTKSQRLERRRCNEYQRHTTTRLVVEHDSSTDAPSSAYWQSLDTSSPVSPPWPASSTRLYTAKRI